MKLTGLVTGVLHSDSLEKLTITYKKGGVKKEKIEALFNPSEISRSRSIQWEPPKGGVTGQVLDKRPQKFIGVQPETLSISLLFDTYESRGDADNRVVGALKSLRDTANPFASGTASDVTKLTREVVRLAKIDSETHEPPVCELSWGEYEHIFTGVLVQLDQHFTMFLPDGTPVRATLDCTFAEYRTRARSKAEEPHSADVVKSRVLRRGDTLHSLAAEEYGDPGLWREIARANRIANPLRVRPGTVLTIPRLEAQGRAITAQPPAPGPRSQTRVG
ncbi:LysM peptidoglycan-binding domain-containing protein [Frankia sp. CNm7]|uniref:LysM peptidoglycan-binding domain-containing protein n=1 Tax=Frankia nepalensis TaxID=1836974 RepID=A0A937ULR5_9ACTN|nr:LysM peptidoglycan-binding domain-containing protein [Frankia nepalensis]MBL7494825.1 LysM peptidoglycan-binding domain-containing protein [Frankia nepalensis]MBL7508974.1 LysM peptidoglycan-binding domain-containing protein [Frankia nepalensis]MBL7524786.1 LysM peptidoglycan-binding domain-containing protein [Frankia nepalensis]MBL7626308.1 LysM peptidoglycan-binding domain-containing protein [Frankia nepalensis]